MKIGIMSMQRVPNYGSFLQAYGLKRIIEDLGQNKNYQVEFVDYRIENALEQSAEEHKPNIANRLVRMLRPSYRAHRRQQIKLGESFHRFVTAYSDEFLPMLGVNEQRNECPKLDALIIGSDEVFNCTQREKNVGYSRQLFGKDHQAKKLISYAASFGYTTLEKMSSHGIDAEVAQLLKGFDAISVRDRNSLDIVQRMTGNRPEQHVDPVLAYDFPEADSISIDLHDYIVVYAYADRLSQNEIAAIREFAKEKKKKILTLGFWQSFSDRFVLADPFQVLAYVKHADYVITDTFHGTVFSIKYGIPFAALIRNSNREKLGDLLEHFGLKNRQVTDLHELGEILKKPMPKDLPNRISAEQRRTRAYLEGLLP